MHCSTVWYVTHVYPVSLNIYIVVVMLHMLLFDVHQIVSECECACFRL